MARTTKPSARFIGRSENTAFVGRRRNIVQVCRLIEVLGFSKRKLVANLMPHEYIGAEFGLASGRLGLAHVAVLTLSSAYRNCEEAVIFLGEKQE